MATKTGGATAKKTAARPRKDPAPPASIRALVTRGLALKAVNLGSMDCVRPPDQKDNLSLWIIRGDPKPPAPKYLVERGLCAVVLYSGHSESEAAAAFAVALGPSQTRSNPSGPELVFLNNYRSALIEDAARPRRPDGAPPLIAAAVSAVIARDAKTFYGNNAADIGRDAAEAATAFSAYRSKGQKGAFRRYFDNAAAARLAASADEYPPFVLTWDGERYERLAARAASDSVAGSERRATREESLEQAATLIERQVRLVMRRYDHDPADGSFFSRPAWRARGESCGAKALLVVTHDGDGGLSFFDEDAAPDGKKRAAAMNAALSKIGCYAEPCSNWASAIYKNS